VSHAQRLVQSKVVTLPYLVHRIIEIGCVCSILESMHRKKLTADERGELEAVIRKRSGVVALQRRARCVLLWADA